MVTFSTDVVIILVSRIFDVLNKSIPGCVSKHQDSKKDSELKERERKSWEKMKVAEKVRLSRGDCTW